METPQSTLQKLVLALVRCYRRCISPFFPPSCRYYPTCSEYALQAVTERGARTGSWLALKRILRCHPFSAGGYDPVPPSTDTVTNNQKA